ncbi:ABC transporter permease subunit [Rhizobium leguminosarum]|uniref:ABC transporter permease n=1 Tax=Rhizobium ruizarguesonis TaxID=2081791 RepID=UPI0013BC2BE5|nr:ABC transporter permease [Rhizobium ruizarguesonis]MBY5848383.1 ABC transporter permease [Rhizobium leguminosarum]NEH86853.1 ABC transporter permease subunit [Rhizobium ruizarguesonis]NEI16936.1 ABC transporter permease subunit [Rhizobium ruizarguesonis]NEJ61084.1 ABC transporter permease subunit [Rhizobium ruizarguesonis]NEJ65767.1 ABC transporter permease subunit [Rhizobium ruizarguesonis]
MNWLLSVLFRLMLAGVLTFITLPLAVVMAASFSPTSAVAFRPWEWTARWYGDLVSERWLLPFLLSVKIAVIVSIVSGIIGVMAAYAVVYEKIRGSEAAMSVLLLPLSVPQIVKGVAIVLFLSLVGLQSFLGTPALIAAHIVLALPFVVRMVATSIANFDRNLDRAGQILGANKRQRVQHILLPAIRPGVLSGMTFAFIISFNNIPLSVFLVRPGDTTLPITVINYLEYSLDPVMAAVNVASMIFILAVIFLFEKIGGFSVKLHGGSK